MKIVFNIEETNNFAILITIERFVNEEFVFASTFSVYRNGNINDAFTLLNDIYDMIDDMIDDTNIEVKCNTTCIAGKKIFDLIHRYIKREKL